MKCFYHSADLDGHCAGAVVKFKHPECELVGINYGDKFPWDTINLRETVFMVDFSLQPFSDMAILAEQCDLIWIDHHQTAIDESKKYRFIAGTHISGIGACFLAWEYLFSEQVPYAIKLLAEYDVWNHSNPMTLPFQYGMRIENTVPEQSMLLWEDLFTGGQDACEPIATAGVSIIKYCNQLDAKYCESYAFDNHCFGLSAVCLNRGFTGSLVFKSVYNPYKHDIMVSFCRRNNQWDVGLYSDKQDINCGEIAKQYGGGGHKGAAGFQCIDLPFNF